MHKPCRVRLVNITNFAIYGNPLGLAYLKLYAEKMIKSGLDIGIEEVGGLDRGRLSGARRREAEARLLASGADIIGFACYLWNVEEVFRLCRRLKAAAPGLTIVLGGPDATCRGAGALLDSGADVLVSGEGEETFAELLGRFMAGKDLKGVPGSACRSGSKVLAGPSRKPMADLDAIPSPYLRGMFEAGKYRFLIYETSRGCPYNCSFCAWTYRGPVNCFPLSRMKREIAAIYALKGTAGAGGQQTVFVADSDPLRHEARALDLLAFIRARYKSRELYWVIQTELKFWTGAIAKAANFEAMEFCFGIQSASPGVVEEAGRLAMNLSEMEEKLLGCARVSGKAKFVLQLILGLPGDTPAGFRKSLTWALKTVRAMYALAGYRTGQRANFSFSARVEVFPLSVFPNGRLAGLAAGLKWSPKPPYLLTSSGTFPARLLKDCMRRVERLCRLPLKKFGKPAVFMSAGNNLI